MEGLLAPGWELMISAAGDSAGVTHPGSAHPRGDVLRGLTPTEFANRVLWVCTWPVHVC